MNPESIPVEAQPIAWVTEDASGTVIQFNVEWFKKLLQSGVYLINDKTHMLYVGMAGNLLARISSSEHKAARLALNEQEVDQVLIVLAKSRKQALEFESRCILEFQPKYNVVGKTNEVEHLPDSLP